MCKSWWDLNWEDFENPDGISDQNTVASWESRGCSCALESLGSVKLSKCLRCHWRPQGLVEFFTAGVCPALYLKDFLKNSPDVFSVINPLFKATTTSQTSCITVEWGNKMCWRSGRILFHVYSNRYFSRLGAFSFQIATDVLFCLMLISRFLFLSIHSVYVVRKTHCRNRNWFFLISTVSGHTSNTGNSESWNQ